MISRSNPTGVAAPIGKYHHITTVPACTDIVFISGQVGNHLDRRPVDPSAEAQARQAFANLGTILDEIGAVPADIVKLVTFAVGTDSLAGFRVARDEVFAAWYPDGAVPAHSLAVVTALAAPELLLEIEAVVAVSRS
ncbi:RidA family protein [Yinghuangia aomiensis]|uniref:RidA family protein n=1 Tax=Yinghuangia aomiensis TaxID=676205 RepID=A0ABP9IDY3_9ACTN